MMPRRNCAAVIQVMMDLIPKDKSEFLTALQWNLEDAAYKPPEETLQWERTGYTLSKYIPIPEEDWEFQVVSVFTTESIDSIRAKVAEFKKMQAEGFKELEDQLEDKIKDAKLLL